ncbi:helix-turn-helix domain-containing protein [Arsenicibacter rosenii]|uniref:Helix-turn-helix domain-containing protein n=1 Tax=Arsenicibacter rosenii TaxID=1750698 RepID=A0A1S2VDM8_9BACT|nr:helix-turn-helix domain-containing protein [Arsenicibacter rosenii]OIN56316.1 hypothetical protein BLX24_25110 [Arsenicibacter rosenii]
MLIAIDEAILKKLIITLEGTSTMLQLLRTKMEEDRPMTYEDAAKYLSVSVSTVKNYVNRGWIAATRIKTGHKDNDVFVRILRSDLDDFLRKGRVEARL